jgi:hypothetical protein
MTREEAIIDHGSDCGGTRIGGDGSSGIQFEGRSSDYANAFTARGPALRPRLRSIGEGGSVNDC